LVLDSMEAQALASIGEEQFDILLHFETLRIDFE
jgi:hypothetical protein